MGNDLRKSLEKLGAETLASALIQLADTNEEAQDMVERMIATKAENIKHFKGKIAGLKRARRFVKWGASSGLAKELIALLSDLEAAKPDPCVGAELVVSFYQTDNGTLGRCDDSNGHVGDVYRYDAKELFLYYARQCEDKDWLEKLVAKLNHQDDYGVRDTLIDCAAEYLPEPNIRSMIGKFQILADKETEKYAKRHWLYLIESLARQIKDALLYEKTRMAVWEETTADFVDRGKLPIAACIDIGRVYLESGDVHTGLSWLERIPEDESFMADKRDKLLIEIHGRLGNIERQREIALRVFRGHRSVDTLQKFLELAGEEERDSVIAAEVAIIGGKARISTSDAVFLLQVGLIDETESYILERSDQLNGDRYHSLLPLAQTMEGKEKYLAASLIYRALLNSILRKARSKTYHHGVRYLKKLDLLEKLIPDWRDFENHELYTEHLRQKHGRKRSFWAKYE